MTSLIRRFALVTCMLAIGAQASAEVVLVSQSRSVHAYVDLDGDPPVSLSAPDFGLFEENLVLAWSCIGHQCSDSGYFFDATQNSEIQAGHFSIHGHTSGSVWDEQGYYTLGGAGSDFEVLFEVTVPTPFSLIGSLVSGGGASIYSTANCSLHLDWNGAPYLSFSTGSNQEEIVVNEQGILEPGVYTLTVNAVTEVLEIWHPEPFTSSFDIDFLMGSPVPVQETTWGQIKSLYR